MSGENHRQCLVSGEMRQRFLERAGKMELLRFGRHPENRFAEAVDAVRSGFEGLRGGIVGTPGDYNLQRVAREKRGGEAVGRGEHSVLGSDASKSFERFLCKVVIPFVAGEPVHANQRDRRDGIGSGRGRILERLAANVEPAHWHGVRGPIEKAAAFCITIAGDGEVHRFLCRGKIARIEGRFVSIQQSQNAENLVIE